MQSYDWANTYTDQEGVVWTRESCQCPRCERPTNFDRRVRGSGMFLCECGVIYDEPTFEPAESAFVTCISDDESAVDPDPEVRRRYREYHGLPAEA